VQVRAVSLLSVRQAAGFLRSPAAGMTLPAGQSVGALLANVWKFQSSGSPLDKETGNSREARFMVSSPVGHSARNAAANLGPVDVLKRRPVWGTAAVGPWLIYFALIDGILFGFWVKGAAVEDETTPLNGSWDVFPDKFQIVNLAHGCSFSVA